MKKIFTLVCAAIVALGLNAAPRQFNGQIGANGKPVFKHSLQHVEAHHRARKAASALLENENFSFQISDITGLSANLVVTPVDKSAAYMYGYIDAATYATMSENDISTGMQSQMDYYIMLGYFSGEELTYADFASVGDYSKTLIGLDANTEYVVFAYLLDLESGLALSAFDTAHFTTNNSGMSDNVISMNYANDTLYISTTNDDPYFFWMESLDEFEYYYGEDRSDATLKEELNWQISEADSYGYLGYLIFYGDTAINVNDFNLFIFGEDLESDDYIALAAPFNMAINGAPKYHEFQFAAAPIVCTDTTDIHIVSPEWLDAVAEQGWWQVTGAESTDSVYYVSLSNKMTDVVPGIYNKEDMDMDYTGIFVNDVYVSFASVVVEIVEQDGNYIITAEGAGKNSIYYRLTFDAIPVGGTGLEEIAAQIQSMGNKFLHHGQVMIHNNGHFYHMLGGQLK